MLWGRTITIIQPVRSLTHSTSELNFLFKASRNETTFTFTTLLLLQRLKVRFLTACGSSRHHLSIQLP